MTELVRPADVALDADDREIDTNEASPVGGPVDPPEDTRTLYGTVTGSVDHPRAPIVPAWLRNTTQRREMAVAALNLAGYTVAFHTVRAPLYAARTVVYGVWGAGRLTARQVGWWWVAEQEPLRKAAADRGDSKEWSNLHREAKRTRSWRGIVLGGQLAVVAALVGFITLTAPIWAQVLAAAVALLILARFGGPVGRPILDRVQPGARFTRLTAEMVRNALVDMNVPRLKDPAALTFPADIHRDGPGWLARVNLPRGVLAAEVVAGKDKLSSSLRLPPDQVWPEVGPEHPGQLDLFVSCRPASKMGAPTWPLLDVKQTSVFDPVCVGFDARMRAVVAPLMETNWLIGGQPGSGKTYGARTIALVAALDPTCELMIAAYKPAGDFADLEPLCSRYVCGLSPQDFDTGASIIEWAGRELERRGERVSKLRERGDMGPGSVPRHIAERRGSGLHPVVIIIDEAHELFAAVDKIGDKLARVIRLARMFNIVFVLATQVADADSVPTVITKCVSVRWCMSVRDWQSNDAILGTGSYKAGLTATGFRPRVDAGWGMLAAGEHTGPTRAWFPDEKHLAKVLQRAAALRGQMVASPTEPTEPARDLLADVLAVLLPAEAGAPWDVLAERLAELLPTAYPGLTGDALRELLAPHGVVSKDVKVDGRNRKGCRRTELTAAIGRQITD